MTTRLHRLPFAGDPTYMTSEQLLTEAAKLEHRAVIHEHVHRAMAQACRDTAKSLRELAASEVTA